MAYEYESDIPKFLKGIEYEHPLDLSKEIKEIQEVYSKAKAFDNYMVDLVKSIETYPHEYEKHANFLKETYEFYMQDKEDFIKGYKDEVRRGHEIVSSVEEYDEIIKNLEDK